MKNPYESSLIEPIKVTKARKKFTEALKNALIKGYDFDNLNVSDLCRMADLSRTTFYANYETVRDVLNELHDIVLYDCFKATNILTAKKTDSNDIRSALVAYIDSLMLQEDVYRVFLVQHPDYEFIEKWKNIMKYRFWKFYALVPNYDFILDVITGAVVVGVSYIIRHPNKFGREVYVNTICTMFETALRINK